VIRSADPMQGRRGFAVVGGDPTQRDQAERLLLAVATELDRCVTLAVFSPLSSSWRR
jgi:hypothetical protein